VTLEHEMSRVFQGLILSLRKPVVLCTVLTILLKSKRENAFNLLVPELFFLILAHPVYKM